MRILIFIITAGFILTCSSIQKKSETKQVEENRESIALIEDARNLIKNSELPEDEKKQIFETFAKSQNSIINSTETIKDCIEFKSQALAKNYAYQQTIKKQKKWIFYLCIPYALIILFYVFKIIYRFTPAGAAINQLTSEIKSIKNKLK